MGRGLALAVCQALEIHIHQGAISIKVEILFLWVVAQRIERATKRFVVAKRATIAAEVVALYLYTNTAKLFFFLLGKSDFEGGIARLNVTATLAFGAVVKQHASTPRDT